MRFLKNDNSPIDLSTEALHVSNYVTNEGLPVVSQFSGTCDDPSNFRLEVEDDLITEASVTVKLIIGEAEHIFVLDKKAGGKFRGEFLRLVTDAVDDSVQAGQTLLCKLGDYVELNFTTDPGNCEDKITTEIGRSSNSTPNNGPNQLRHEIRDLLVAIKVFAKPENGLLFAAVDAAATTIQGQFTFGLPQASGWIKIGNEIIHYTAVAANGDLTGCTRGADGTTAVAHAQFAAIKYSSRTPCVTEASVKQDVEIANQRFAQSTIRLSETIQMNGGMGLPLPGVLLDGFRWGKEGPGSPWNEDELKLISMKSGNANTVDVFYITPFSGPPLPTPQGIAIAYAAFLNAPPNQVPNGKNFIVMKALSDAAKSVFTLPHEFMHILLNMTHRPGDAIETLFRTPTSDNIVYGTKRIGPWPDAGPGSGDTFTMRTNVLSLP